MHPDVQASIKIFSMDHDGHIHVCNCQVHVRMYMYIIMSVWVVYVCRMIKHLRLHSMDWPSVSWGRLGLRFSSAVSWCSQCERESARYTHIYTYIVLCTSVSYVQYNCIEILLKKNYMQIHLLFKFICLSLKW